MTYYLAYCQGDILLTKEGNIPFGIQAPFPVKPWNKVTTLQKEEDSYEILRLDTPITDNPEFQMVGLRPSFCILAPTDYQIAGKGAELVYWDRNTKYCGMCGAPLEWQTAISKQCPECKKEWWPSLAIAIIVRVERGEEILMVHAHSFRDKHFGLVAGFVETGETLEECVRREVKEEAGIEIEDIRYFGSQPWPYPCGLMVGFTAKYSSGNLYLQKEELNDGGWFHKENMPELPGKASIARELVEDWLSMQKQTKE